MKAETNEHESTSNFLNACEGVPERRIWLAVLVQAVEEWRQGTLRARREAESFLFKDQKDFERVCSAAGLDASVFRARLSQIHISPIAPMQARGWRLGAA